MLTPFCVPITQGLKIVCDASHPSPSLPPLPFPSSFPFPIPFLPFYPSRGNKLCPPSLSKSSFARNNSSVGTQKGFFRPCNNFNKRTAEHINSSSYAGAKSQSNYDIWNVTDVQTFSRLRCMFFFYLTDFCFCFFFLLVGACKSNHRIISLQAPIPILIFPTDNCRLEPTVTRTAPESISQLLPPISALFTDSSIYIPIAMTLQR